MADPKLDDDQQRDLARRLAEHDEDPPNSQQASDLFRHKHDLNAMADLLRDMQAADVAFDPKMEPVIQSVKRIGKQIPDGNQNSEVNKEPDVSEASQTGHSLHCDALIAKLLANNLINQDQVAPARQKLSANLADEYSLANSLIDSGLLTAGQTQAFIDGGAKELLFGEYVITDQIGAGGMGVILKAKQVRLERQVAIKVLSKRLLVSPQAVNRFFREVRAAAKLTHKNVVRAYDAGEYNTTQYLVMEFVDGQDLSHICNRVGSIPIAEAIACSIQAANGLGYAHQQGLIHRDVKPANLLLDEDGTVKVLDMGLARLGESDTDNDKSALTKSGQIMGTIDYMAPEQATNTHLADARSDIYSLGCTLYRLITGQRMYDRGSTINKLLAHAKDDIPSLAESCASVPPELEDVFRRMVAKNPRDRQQTMAEVIVGLRAAVATIATPEQLAQFAKNVRKGHPHTQSEIDTADTISVTLATPPSHAISEKTARNPGLPTVATITLVLAAIVGILWWPSGQPIKVSPSVASPSTVTPNTASPNAVTDSLATPIPANSIVPADSAVQDLSLYFRRKEYPIGKELQVGRRNDCDLVIY